ncbi:uncharacterized protein KQ657_000911 [Scheffersomyces spartinae]|uniref:Uncharacterized protein n=1 Tax=Scheffersomyces spartinae TaxID=45513 RepID=A0A9P7V8G8_9ASCO|nr:uncharacterized protein KQ657_000911 [Scheffersomyces spartinae]KAG7193157.1 hypothetical protein KQ657_000911 [Scheffersomyces spartinae]
MDYLNSHFVSVKSLAGLDDRISDLQQERKQLVAAKETTTTLNQEKPPARATTRQTFLREKVQRLSNGFDIASALSEVDLLIEKNSDVEGLTELRRLYFEKQSALNDNRILAIGSELEREITRLAGDEKGILNLVIDIDRRINSLKSYNSNLHEVIRNELRAQLNEIVNEQMTVYKKELSQLLRDCKWLTSVSASTSTSLKDQVAATVPLEEIHDKVNVLIQLQAIKGIPKYPDTWVGIDLLVEIVIQKFDYHFNSFNKETNKLLKPEWAFNYIELFLENHLELLVMVIGDSFPPYQKISSYEIISSLLKPLREKIFSTVKQLDKTIKERPERIEKNGRLLTHLIFEVVSFDQRIRSTYNYNPYIENIYEVPVKPWEGITGDLLHNPDTNAADQWFEFEQKLAERRFESEILNAPNANAIEYDYRVHDNVTDLFERRHLKPTVAAYNLIKLFDNLTTHYLTISIVKYQLKYVSSIQLRFIDRYLATLATSLKKFDVKFNFIPGNTPQPMDDEDKVLETLTQLFCLAKFVEENLQKRTQEILFVELWNTFKAMEYENNEYNDDNNDFDIFSSLFDSSIQQYTKFITKVQIKITDYLKKQAKNSLKKYVNTSQWNIPESDGDLEPSGDLRGLIVNVLKDADLLRKAVSDLEFSYLAQVMLSTIAKIFQEFIITNNKFSVTGVEQLSVDYHYILSQIDSQLLLHETYKYSVGDNQDHHTVLQSISVLKAASRRGPDLGLIRRDLETFRMEFDNLLLALSNRQIDDLLQRML